MPQAHLPAFISYSRADSTFVLRLAKDLRAAGANIWLDQADIAPGHHWDDAIEAALKTAPSMVLVLSPDSAQSRNVRNEIAFALDHGKEIIPVFYKDCEVPLQLGRHQRIDFRTDYAAGLRVLLAQLQKVRQPAGQANYPPTPEQENPGHAPGRNLLTRRNFAIGSALAACGAAAAIGFNRQRLLNLMHPLPAKRFVAVVGWPFNGDDHVAPAIATTVGAIVTQLTRYEASDHDLVILTRSLGSSVTGMAQLNEIKESLGANLVLAVSGQLLGIGLRITLSIIDPALGAVLREATVSIPQSALLSITEKTVPAAAQLLGLQHENVAPANVGPGTSNSAAYAFFQQGEVARGLPNDTGLKTAIGCYLQALNLDARFATAEAALAWAYLRSHGIDRDQATLELARRNAVSAISHSAELATAHVALAWVYVKRGDFDSAHREMATALAIDPRDPHTLTYQGNMYILDNLWKESEIAFERLLALRPNYWLAYSQFAWLLGMEGNYKEALLKLETANTLNPGSAQILRDLGGIQLCLGHVPEADAALSASYALIPGDTTAALMAEVCRIQPDYARAISFAETATNKNPAVPANWLELGDVYTSARRSPAEIRNAYSKALSTQTESLESNPKDGPGWMNLALAQAKLGQSDTAYKLLSKAESLHADDMNSQLNKVRILELTGHRAQALDVIKECLNRGPTKFLIDTMVDLQQVRASSDYAQITSAFG